MSGNLRIAKPEGSDPSDRDDWLQGFLVLVVCVALAVGGFIYANDAVSQRTAVVMAAKLSEGQHDTPFPLTLIGGLALSIAGPLDLFGMLPRAPFTNHRTRWRWVAVLAGVIIGANLLFLCLGGRTAPFLNTQGFGLVREDRVVRFTRWTEANAVDVGCKITKGSIYPDLDRALKIENTLRAVQSARPKPVFLHIVPEADCAKLMVGSSQEETYSSLFAPVTP